MSDTERLLERIEEGLVAHGGDLGGWTRRADGALQIFDGRVTLRAELREGPPVGEGDAVHTHVFATLHEFDDEVLDACVMGFGEGPEQAISEAAVVWITCVAGPIRSLLDGRPVCMTCQPGVTGGDASHGYVEGDYGLSGLRAYVGPAKSRGFDGELSRALNETKPWFRFAAESAAPRRIHIAKATILAQGKQGWSRDLEVDGHDVSHHDANWPAGVAAPKFGYITRFQPRARAPLGHGTSEALLRVSGGEGATSHVTSIESAADRTKRSFVTCVPERSSGTRRFPQDSAEMQRRKELERTLRHFAERLPGCPSEEAAEQLMDEMVAQGFDPELVDEADGISTIAFGRAYFEPYGVHYSPTVIRARRDGRIEEDLPLMSLPAYTRARSLAEELRNTWPPEKFQALCFYHPESQGLLEQFRAADGKPNWSELEIFPSIACDRATSDELREAAQARLQARIEQWRRKRRPWWNFW